MPIPHGEGPGLPSRAACEDRPPPPLSPRSRGPSLPSPSERRGGGTRCYKPRPQCHSAPPAASGPRWPEVSCGRGPSPQCLVSPGPSAPRAVAVSVPQEWGAQSALPAPLRPRGLHGRILFPRCHWAMCRGGEGGRWEALAPDSCRPPCLRRHSVITGKENCFKTRPC